MTPSPPEPTSPPVSMLCTLAKVTTEIKDKLKIGDYDRELKGLAEYAVGILKDLHSDQSALASVSKACEDRLDYLTALGWAADVMEYFGQLTEGTDTYGLIKDEGSRIHRDLVDRPRPAPDLAEKIAREEIWVALSWARALYRMHKYGDALRVLDRCENFVKDKLQREGSFECRLTLAGLWSLHAKILRQQVNLQDAKVYYDRALARIYPRLRSGDDARVNCEVARILALGHGWILYTQGLLQEARAAVSTALVILHKTNDVIYKAYGELLLCAISRATIGIEQPGIEQPAEIHHRTLTETIQAMQKPYDTFKEYGHEPYAVRAAYELALCYLYRGLSDRSKARKDFVLAEEKLQEVLVLDDRRWQANGWVVMSRLRRAQADLEKEKEGDGKGSDQAWKDAEASAKRALEIATEANLDFCKIDAHIAFGEVCAGQPNADDHSLRAALDHFNDALQLASKNPKPSAVCHLHLAEVHLRRGNLRDAQLKLAEWRKVENKIQHGFVRAFGRKVSDAVRQAEQTYLIVDTKDSLNIEQHTNRLVRFLLTQAKARYTNFDERLKMLGIKRATYYNLWRRFGEAQPLQAVDADPSSSDGTS
jgi:tetratricopeptide (TPR) repeat protein